MQEEARKDSIEKEGEEKRGETRGCLMDRFIQKKQF
jgi:hypothetical protein